MKEVENLIVELTDAGVELVLVDGKLKARTLKSKISADMLDKIKAYRNEIIAYLKSNAKIRVLPDIKRRSDSDDQTNQNDFFLSFAQQRLWLLDQIDGSSTHYNIPIGLKLQGQLDLPALEKSLVTIVERHESLRTCFVEDNNGQIIQNIQAADLFSVHNSDLSVLDPEPRELALTNAIDQETDSDFDLSTDLMLRAHLVKLADQEFVLLVTMHHIASDGWSMSLLINEFSVLYKAYAQGNDNPLPSLAIQYADYAHWQRNWLKGEVLDQQLDYWAQQLADLPVAHSLPLDHARPKEQSFVGNSYYSEIDKDISEELNALCQTHGATLFMGLQAAFSALLSRYSNEKDIVMGSPIANREQAQVVDLIGFFVNTLVLRSDLSNNPSFNELLGQSKKMLLEAYAYQQVPFEQIVERLQPERNLSHSPLFQVMLVLQNNEEGSLELPGLTLSSVEQGGGIAKYDLTLTATESAQGLSLSWEYNTDLFDGATIERMAKHFSLLLSDLLKAPDQSVFSANMLSETERHQLLVEWNDTTSEYPKDQCIHQLFEQQVEADPDAIAVIFEEQRLTYGELNVRANQLAHYLVNEHKVTPDTLVGLCVERSVEMIVGILGILKAGGAYVPLDPDYPQSRLAYMLEDANLSTVITQSHLLERKLVTPEQGLCLDDTDIKQKLSRQSSENLNYQQLGLMPSHLAYVIYTSGSTGAPKGVMVIHSGLSNYLNFVSTSYMPHVEGAITSSPIAFDATITSLLGPLTNGKWTHVLPKNEAEIEQLAQVMLSLKQPVLFKITPAHLDGLAYYFQDTVVSKLPHYLIVGGEQLSKQTAALWKSQLLPEATIVNEYGPTETVVGCSIFKMKSLDQLILNTPAISIGKPIQNTQLVILNQSNLPVSIGIAGELHIGGAGLARGYLNQADLTAEKFIANPFYDENVSGSSDRLYKTGDLVRWLPDGNLEFLGRIDHQVKIRGFRIELGEIENTLNDHDSVKGTVVEAKDAANGEKRLVAYVVTDAVVTSGESTDSNDVADTEHQAFIAQMRQHLKVNLPDYMVPSAFVLLDKLPLTTNGKIDRKALPEPDMTQQQAVYVAPSTETEKTLCDIWQQVLDLECIGITDDFFELGGHSLLVVKVIARLQKVDITMTARQLFLTPILSELAAIVDASSDDLGPVFIAPDNLIPANCQHITPELLPLVTLTQDQIDQVVTLIPGGVENIQDIYPLAPLQSGILYHHMMNKDNDPYVMPMLFNMPDRQALDGFVDAIQFIINRHDVLRTSVLWQGLATPLQVVCRQADVPVSWPELDAEQDISAQMSALSAPDKQWMDISSGPLLRLQLAQAPDSGQCFVLLRLHHIISDHVGLEIIQQEVVAYLEGHLEQLKPTRPYREFIAHALSQEEENDAQGFFTDMLGDVDTPTTPFDLVDIKGDGSHILELSEMIPDEVSTELRAIAKKLKLSPAVLFHTAWAMVVAACSGRDDVVFGTVLSGRLQGLVGAEDMIGMFINTLPVRIKLHNTSVMSLVRQVQRTLQDLLSYEQASLALAQHCSALSGDVPLFSALLNYRHSGAAGDMELAENTSEKGGQERTNYPFTLSVDDLGDRFALEVQVDDAITPTRVICYMQTALAHLVKGLSTTPDLDALSMSVLPEDERHQQLAVWNDMAQDFGREKCIHELFEAQVDKNPDGIALVFEDIRISYGELNTRANQIAHYLITHKQVKPDTLVGLCFERSPDMVIALLGILKAGGAYVPLDPNYPASRLSYLLNDAKVTTVITLCELLDSTPVSDDQALCLDADDIKQALSVQPTSNPVAQQLGLTSNHLAYVIYTSGSTGEPKGVMVEHYNITRLMDASDKQFTFNSDDVWTLFHSFAFDFSVWEIWGALRNGARLVIVPYWISRSPSDFYRLVVDEGVTVLNQTPSAFNNLIDEDAIHENSLSLRYVIFGGEALNLEALAPWVNRHGDEQPQLINMYGITETTVHVTYRRLTKACLSNSDGASLIGRPLADLELLILNEHKSLVPVGVAGEMYVGGAGVTRGYLNQADLTRTRFIELEEFGDKKFYRTGDLARFLDNGELAYLGRIDHQVKIRGFRIELGEIENTLTTHEHIKDTVVLAKEGAGGDKRLVAYVLTFDSHSETPDEQHAFIEQLRQYLSLHLPEHMVPSVFVLLEKFPLTANGKVDLKALPDPDMSLQQGGYLAPVTETEKVLCQIWQEVLELERVGTNDNFFQLGGHSLMVIKMIARLQQAGITMAVRQLYTAPRLMDLAELLESSDEAVSSVFQAPENLIPDGCEQITPEMLPLVSLSTEEIANIVAKVPGGTGNVQDIYPLGPLQEGLLFHHMMSTQGDAYVVPSLLKIQGETVLNNFITALQFVISRHDVLRTAILWQGLSVPVQVVYRHADLPVTWLEPTDGQDSLSYIQEFCAPERQEMDLSQASLLKLKIVREGDSEKFYVLTQMHHIIDDATSLQILLKEVDAYLNEETEDLPVPVPYREFVAHALYQAEHYDAQSYFTRILGDIDTPTALFNLLDVQGDGSRIVEIKTHVPVDIVGSVRHLAKEMQMSPAVIFHAAWSMVIAACCGENDVVFGTVVSGRLQGTLGAENMMGVFINTLPLRVKLGGVNAEELVQQVKHSLQELLPYEQTSLAAVQRCTNLPTETPLFSAMLNYRHVPDEDSSDTDNSEQEIEYLTGQERTNYPFHLSVNETGKGFLLEIQADLSVDAQKILNYTHLAVAQLVNALLEESKQPVSEFSILSEEELHQQLVQWNDTAADYPTDTCIHELFEAQVEQTPDAIAVVFEDEVLTYRELNTKANQLAHYLIEEKAITPDTLVGICVERSLDMVVGIMAILKAGGAYVPLDPDYPQARLEYMLEDAGLETVLTQRQLADKVPVTTEQAVYLNDRPVLDKLAQYSTDNIKPNELGLTAHHLAYVIYTSGSTGRPKGVMIEHSNTCALFQWAKNTYKKEELDLVLASTSICFDLSVYEIIVTLQLGGSVLVVDNILALPDTEYRDRITLINTVPSAISELHKAGNIPQSVKVINLAGEPLKQSLVCSLYTSGVGKVFDLYGPSEDTTYSTFKLRQITELSSIGKPICNTTTYIVDKFLNPVPVGLEGELCVGGAGLARGYLNQPALTAEKFITNPFSDQPDAKLYKTADLCRYLPNGDIEYIGRIDNQVKIRGFRIELGEIESVLSAFDEVNDAVVVARETDSGDKSLVAYVVTDKAGEYTDEDENSTQLRHAFIEGLRQGIVHSLPDYMVPSAFVVLDKLPLTPNGKLDRNALVAPDMSLQQAVYVAPTSDIEKDLCEIWQEVLDLEQVGITDNFFDLGGHSLLATRVIAKINHKFTVELALKIIFSCKTIEQLVPVLLKQDQVLARPNLVPVSRDQALLPSFAQQRLWLLDKIDGGSAHYNMPAGLKITAELDKKALEKSLKTIVGRHESLRTCFVEDEKGQAIQIIRSEDDFSVQFIDLSEIEEAARESSLNEIIAREADTVFDLSDDFMLRACLVRLAPQDHVLLVTMHHIASDGWSMSILINEFSTLYTAYTQGDDNPLPPLVIQYADYACWQRDWLQGEVLDEQVGYWTTQLANLPMVHNLPLDHVRPEVQSFVGENHFSHIKPEVSKSLKTLCQSGDATLFMGIHAAFSALLSHYSNETDIVMGTPIANREQEEVANLIGFFVNTLVLRSDLSDNPSFNALLQQSKDMLLEAYAHQQVPFEQIVEQLQPQRSLRHSPLFQVMLVLQNNEEGELSLSGLSLETVGQASTVAKYDLTLNVTESDEGLELVWQYNSDLFNALTIQRLADSFERLLDSLVTTPENNVLTAELLSGDEIHQQLVQYNDTAKENEKDECIHDLFEAQAEKNPDAIALVFEEDKLTYGELNARANQLAHYLTEQRQVKPDTLVGLCVERSLNMVVGILGILKAGAAYVPLDPGYPTERLAYMIEDSELALVLTEGHLLNALPVNDEQAECLDEQGFLSNLNDYSSKNISVSQLGLTSRNLAYVIYTSGSTGQPKGVMVEHRSVVRLVIDSGFMSLNSDTRFLQAASVSFDAATLELWAPLLNGGVCVLYPERLIDLQILNRVLVDEQVNALWLTAGLFEQWSESLPELPSLNYVIAGGDVLNPEAVLRVKRALSNVTLINGYGPTENTTFTCCHRMEHNETQGASIPIGRAINGTSLYVLNAEQHLSPLGVPGELYVGGSGVARGYLNQQALTDEKFITNPFGEGRLYRTGDLVRYLPDQALAFIGRVDNQVKIRGFRIEPGEIEQVLVAHNAVNSAVVMVQESASGDKQLVAYVASPDHVSDNEENNLDLMTTLKGHIKQSLPDYMVPAVFMVLETLPLTANGKLDRKALPKPDMSLQLLEYVAPSNETENVLCEIWQEVLGIERVGITDNFFESGGHSLLATRVIAKINQKFTVELALKVIFSFQTIEQLVPELLKQDQVLGRPKLEPVSRDQALLPSFAQQRLWLLDKIDGGSTHYNMPTGLKLRGELNKKALEKSLETIVERHESLRTCFAEDEKGQAIQIIRSGADFSVQSTDLSALEEAERESALSEVIASEAESVFDLSQDFMLRACLVQLDPQEHVLLVTMHHIASDGWSMSLLINEFSTLYNAFAKGEVDPLAPLAIQYADYAHWQRNWLQGEVLEQQLGYWTNQLADLPVVHNLPLDHARPEIQSFVGANHSQLINAELSKALNSVCQTNGATLFMGLHGLFSVLLSRYSNETDIVIGTPIANREQEEVADLIGFFVNTLVLRSDLSNNPSFTELVAQSKEMLLGAYAHQQVSFEQIVEKLQPERSLRHSPLFQVMLVLQNNEEGELDLSGLSLESVGQSGIVAKYDLTLNVTESDEGLMLGWKYNSDIFNALTIERLADSFERLLTALVNTPDNKVFSTDLLSKADVHQQLIEWNNTAADFPQEKCIQELFEAQVKANPDAIALVYEDKRLSYGELNSKANQLAHYLIEHKGVKPDTLVGICVERSIEMVVGIFSILKAGGAYLPLDPEYPKARLSYMIEDAALDLVLTTSQVKQSIAISDEQALCLDNDNLQQTLSNYCVDNIAPAQIGLTADNLAYVIYTSGSTGKPKGVMVEHKALANYLHSLTGFCQGVEGSFVNSSICFDGTATSYWLPFVNGKYVQLASASKAIALTELEEKVAGDTALLFKLTPSHLQLLEDRKQDTDTAHVFFIGGEIFTAKKYHTLSNTLKKAQFINHYGPSETTVGAAVYPVQRGQTFTAGSIPFGKPINNVEVFVLDAKGNLLPHGVSGELYIGGAGLARGYLNQNDLTRERFVPNPFYDANIPGSSKRLYMTGDLVRWLAEGNLEYIGRIDHQVKIRGYRIELGEIEHYLTKQQEVKEAVVLAKESSQGAKHLVAYVTTDRAQELLGDDEASQTLRHAFIDALKADLTEALPEYMVPAAFVILELFPLTPNGKVDRKALPDADISSQQASYVAPTTETERILCEIWQDVLVLEQVGIEDNFFELGGHSLLVMEILSKARLRKVSLNVRQIFVTPVLSDLASIVDASTDELTPIFKAPDNLILANCQHITPEMLPLVTVTQDQIDHVVTLIPGGAENIQDIYPLAPLQSGILFLHMMKKDNDPYVMPMLFSMPDRQALDEFVDAMQFIVNRHDVLRTSVLWQGLSTPLQVVRRQADVPVSWPELDAGQDIETQMQALCAPDKQWMDITQGPLLRLQLAQSVDSGECFILLQLHHIISDHVGLDIIQKEVIAYMAGQGDSLTPAQPYRDFIAHVLHQEELNDATAYFTEMLGDIDTPTTPFDLVDVQGDGSNIIELRENVPDEISAQLRELAKNLKLSPAVLFHTAWAMVVAGCSGQDDVVFGTVLSGRLQGLVGAENMMGMFINTLPVRVKLEDNSVIALVRQVQQALQDLLPYEQASLALAQHCSALQGDTPLFSAMFNYRHSGPGKTPGASEELIEGESGDGIAVIGGQERSNYPISLSVDDFGEAFGLDLLIDNIISPERVIGYMQTALASLVDCLGSATEKSISALTILPETELHQQLVQWHDMAKDNKKDECIHDLFEAHVENNPDAIALVFEEEKLTYGELNARANQLAHYLIEQRQVKPDTLVGLCVERSLNMVIGLLGILKAGAAYVPLDPGYPAERLAYMIKDAGLSLVLTEGHLRNALPVNDEQTECLDEQGFLSNLNDYSNKNISVSQMGLNSRNLAYVIYTSGSTGQPKGVMVEHRSVVRLVIDADFMSFNSDTRFLQTASVSFDAATLELWAPLLNGGVCILYPGRILDLQILNRVLVDEQVNTLWLTTALFEQWSESLPELPLLNCVVTGGEVMNPQAVLRAQRDLSHVTLINAYGPTENTTFTSCHRMVHKDTQGIIPIGKAINGTSLYVLNANQHLLPFGVTGELYVGGIGLARGYLNQQALTDEKFITNPFGEGRLYRTGDLVRYLPDQQLTFIGRVDNQVKIRGFRIEPGEIEQALVAHNAVNAAAVLVKNSASGDKQLVAYVASADIVLGEDKPTAEIIASLKEHLKQTMPEYMIPSAFVLLDALPLTMNGKMDRKALPDPDWLQQQTEYRAPTSATEIILVSIWAKLLKLEAQDISVSTSFFELGGHSLLLVKLAVEVQTQWELSVDVKSFFEHQSILELSCLIDEKNKIRAAIGQEEVEGEEVWEL